MTGDDERWRECEEKGTTIPKSIRYGRFDVMIIYIGRLICTLLTYHTICKLSEVSRVICSCNSSLLRYVFYIDVFFKIPKSTNYSSKKSESEDSLFLSVWFTPHTLAPHTSSYAHLRKP